MMSERLMLILPKIDDLRFAGVSAELVAESDIYEASGVNSGASGLNVGPDDEKLNSLWPGVNGAALTLILLPVNVTGGDAGLIGWNVVLKDDTAGSGIALGKIGLVGVNVLAGLNLNSAAAAGLNLNSGADAGLNLNSEVVEALNLNSGAVTFSFDIEALDTCPRLPLPFSAPEVGSESAHGLVVMDWDLW